MAANLVDNRQQSITWTNADPIYWLMYVALGGDELNDLENTWNQGLKVVIETILNNLNLFLRSKTVVKGIIINSN